MWVYLEKDKKALNLNYVSRAVVEEAGPGGQIKAEFNGAYAMVAFFARLDDAERVFEEIILAQGRGEAVYTLRGNK